MAVTPMDLAELLGVLRELMPMSARSAHVVVEVEVRGMKYDAAVTGARYNAGEVYIETQELVIDDTEDTEDDDEPDDGPED